MFTIFNYFISNGTSRKQNPYENIVRTFCLTKRFVKQNPIKKYLSNFLFLLDAKEITYYIIAFCITIHVFCITIFNFVMQNYEVIDNASS